MKKFLTILMTFCLLASVVCGTAFAADAPADDAPAKGTVLRVRAQKGNDLIKIGDGDYKSFEDGWNYAMDIAGNTSAMKTNGYDRIVVDLYADWNATDGEFTDDFRNGPGFDWDTIYIPDDAKVTLNMRGHTINRGLTNNEDNGEVICVDADADLIINDGTITGGHSDNGAGGIHIKSRSKVTLNNVNIVGNAANEDDGGGIHMLGGSTLVMNGGSFRDNTVDGYEIQYSSTMRFYGGAIYVNDSTATFNNVEFKNNNTTQHSNYGAAIYAEDSDVTINGCTFDGNGISDKENDFYGAYSIVHGEDSTLTVTESTFINNGAESSDTIYVGFSGVFALDDSKLFMEKCRFSGNKSYVSINDVDDSLICVTDTEFIDNNSGVFRGDSGTSEYSFFRGCTFNNNAHYGRDYLPTFYNIKVPLTFYNCSMGNSTTVSESKVNMKYVNDNLSSSIVLNVSALKTDGTTEAINDYYVFEDGWNAAMELAKDVDTMKANGYERIVVKMIADWNAKDSQFADSFFNGAGFDWDAIYIPSNAKVTLDMNGHTIDRGLTASEYNGEVICIDENADVIIMNGTITGGNSDNGAGGIHIKGGAMVTLNDVHILKNVTNSVYSAGIAMFDGATLIMKGGSFEGNQNYSVDNKYGAAIYVENSTAILEDVRFYNNQFTRETGYGTAVFAKRSTVTIKACELLANGIYGNIDDIVGLGSYSTIMATSSSIVTVKNTTIKGNGSSKQQNNDSVSTKLISDTDCNLICVQDSSQLFLDTCTITQNYANHYIFDAEYVSIYASNTTVTNNAASVFAGHTAEFTRCKFHRNANKPAFDIMSSNQSVVFTDCEMGDSTYNNAAHAKFVDTDAPNGAGSIFGEGSVTNILVILALVASAASICVSVVLYKKNAALIAANGAGKLEDEEDENQ